MYMFLVFFIFKMNNIIYYCIESKTLIKLIKLIKDEIFNCKKSIKT